MRCFYNYLLEAINRKYAPVQNQSVQIIMTTKHMFAEHVTIRLLPR